MHRTTGRVVLVLSGFGFPLTQMVIARFGRRGAAVVEVVTAGPLILTRPMSAVAAVGAAASTACP